MCFLFSRKVDECKPLAPGARVLITCSRNVAIESIAQKLEACNAEMLVVGRGIRSSTSQLNLSRF